MYLVRHAESEGNVQNLFGGDFPLSARGVEQVRALAEQLSDIKFDVAYSSPLQRACQTAQILTETSTLNIQVIDDLRERWYGSLELQPISSHIRDFQIKLAADNPELLWDHHLVDDDETNRQALDRFLPAILDIARDVGTRTALIVSHGNVIRTLLVHLGVGDFGQIRSGTFGNTAYVKLHWSNNSLAIEEIVGLNMVRAD